MIYDMISFYGTEFFLPEMWLVNLTYNSFVHSLLSQI
jgi:hypothetical protein